MLGVSVLDPKTGEFEFKPGPVFANLVLADEINRTPPRTQSALLEAMNDGQVSVDGRPFPLETPFLVMATQNSEEHYGTYPLPESQMDRFLLRIADRLPGARRTSGGSCSSRWGGPRTSWRGSTRSLSVADVRRLQDAAERVHLSPELADYIVAVARRDAALAAPGGRRVAARRSSPGETPRARRRWPRGATTCSPTI